jgi:two-component system, cell cycle response regulator
VRRRTTPESATPVRGTPAFGARVILAPGTPQTLSVLVADGIGDAGGVPRLVPHDARVTLEVTRVATLEAALASLDRDPIDAVLLGLRGTPMRPHLPLLRVVEAAPDAAVIVLADLAERDSPAHANAIVEAVRLGAQDCVDRAVLASAPLSRIITCAVERQRRVTDLRSMALVDELTGLYNRRGFLALARQQLRIAGRVGAAVSQVYVDLDGLKQINDRLGHRAGDRALIETADLLRETFRDADVIARIGGDEYAVLTVEGATSGAEAMLERLRDRLARRNALVDRTFPLSLSVGIARAEAGSGSSVDELLARADAWMYEQKRAKRTSRPAVLGASADADSAFGRR